MLLATMVVGCTCHCDGRRVAKVVAETISSDGIYIAAVWTWPGSATTSGTTGVNIRDRTAKFDWEKQGAVFQAKWVFPVNLRWVSSREVVVEVAPKDVALERKGEVRKRETQWRDVKVRYIGFEGTRGEGSR